MTKPETFPFSLGDLVIDQKPIKLTKYKKQRKKKGLRR